MKTLNYGSWRSARAHTAILAKLKSLAVGTIAMIGIVLTGCATPPAPVVENHCPKPLSHKLDAAIAEASGRLESGCGAYFDHYFDALLTLAEDRPSAENKQAFSDFLVYLSNNGIVSNRQARDLYNRYFNIKFVSLSGDYNTCSQTCPVRSQVIRDMESELLAKERGLLRASADKDSFYRADHLLKQSQLVLEATCRACGTGS